MWKQPASPLTRMVVARGWREGEMWNHRLLGIELQFFQKKKVLEIDGGDGYTLGI